MWVEVVGAAVAAAGGMAWAVRSPKSSLLAPSVHCGVRTRRALALTFDDGPSESTPRLLELLARANAKATFFMCGANVERLPEVARAVVRAGHQVGNHTYSHPMIQFKSPEFIYSEMLRAQCVIEDTTGVKPALFRAPFGVRWFGLRSAQRRLELLGVMWTVIGRDWRLTGEAVARRVLRGAGPGAIVCLHDGRTLERAPDMTVTLDTIQRALPVWADQGYHFDTVSQILCQTT
jgi:peptidoglycan-N-acetylglucosamine deacetylase